MIRAGFGVVAVGLLIALPAAQAETAASADGPPRPVVSVIVAAAEDVGAQVYYGQVAARVVTNLGFAQGGELAERPVRRGDIVAAGALLASLDPADLEARLSAAEAGYAAAEAQLQQAADAEARLEALVGRGSASAVQLEGATLARAAAEAAVNQAAASLASARDLRDTARLTAPDAGVVLQTFAEPGANLNPGQPVVQLAGLSGREVLIDLTEAELARLGATSQFHVALDANPAIVAIARLVSVDPLAERATRTRRVHLGLTDPPEAFRIGALARVSLTSGAEIPPGLALPVSAIVANADQSFVWRIARPSGLLSRVAVQVAPGNADPVLIVGGLTEGDEILIKGVHSVSDGQTVGARVTP